MTSKERHSYLSLESHSVARNRMHELYLFQEASSRTLALSAVDIVSFSYGFPAEVNESSPEVIVLRVIVIIVI